MAQTIRPSQPDAQTDSPNLNGDTLTQARQETQETEV